MIILQILIGLIAIIVAIAAVWGMLYGIGRLVFPLLVLIGLQNKYNDPDWDEYLMHGLMFIFLIVGIFLLVVCCVFFGQALFNLII